MSIRPTLAGAGRAVATVAVLAGAWLFAVETWIVRWPAMLTLFVIALWPLAVAAWRPVARGGWAMTLTIAAVLLVIDLAADMWFGQRRLTSIMWEGPRIALFCAVAWLVRSIPDRRPIRVALHVARVLAALPIALLFGLAIMVAVLGTRDETARADAALLLGYVLQPSGEPEANLISRVDHAARLYHDGVVTRIVASGGGAKAGKLEAEVMHDLLVARGVPSSAIIREDRAGSTEENFACGRPLLAQVGARRVLLVTEPWHMTRAMYQSRRHMGDVELLQSPATSALWESWRGRTTRLYREAIAYMVERVRRFYRDAGRCPTSVPQ